MDVGLYLGSFYRPPKRIEEEYLMEFNKSLTRIMSNKNAHVLVGDDFNCGDTMEHYAGTRGGTTKANTVSTFGNCLSQVVNIHTRNDKTFDLLLTNSPSQLTA